MRTQPIQQPTCPEGGPSRAFWSEQDGYRRIFIAARGEFPHPCHFCGETVEPQIGRFGVASPVIHHVDHDRSNSDPSNLVPAHNGCHVSYHARSRSPETRAAMSAANRRRTITPEFRARMREVALNRAPEHNAKIGEAGRGRFCSPTTRAKIAAAARAAAKVAPRASCVACRREFSVRGLPMHIRACLAEPIG